MKVLSLFDGMACGYEALVRAGFKVDEYSLVIDVEDADNLGIWKVNIQFLGELVKKNNQTFMPLASPHVNKKTTRYGDMVTGVINQVTYQSYLIVYNMRLVWTRWQIL